jgi:hypothetical protein
MLVMAGLLLVALVANALVRPVDRRHHLKEGVGPGRNRILRDLRWALTFFWSTHAAELFFGHRKRFSGVIRGERGATRAKKSMLLG